MTLSARQIPLVGAPLAASPVRVLVVDDEPNIAASLAELLSRKDGYEVTIARGGREAMSILEREATDPSRAIDLVLLDVRMPVMSGPEVLAWLRSHPELRFTRVIMLTAAAGSDEKVEALSSGADDYITKPYNPLELLARVKTILRTQQLEKQLQRQSQQLLTLNQISRAVTTKLTTADILALATEGVDAVIGVEIAAVYMIDGERSLLRCRQLHAGRATDATSLNPVPVGQGLIGHVFQDSKSMCLNEPESHALFRSDLDMPAGRGLHSIMIAPLRVRGQAVGVVSAFNKRGGSFTDIDRGLFTSLASSVSRAVEVAWLFQSVRQRQTELLQSRNELQAIIDGILHPIYTIDESWRVVAVNDTKRASMDQDESPLIGRHCYQSFYGRDEPCQHCQVDRTLRDKESQNWSVKWQGADHRPREWDINAYPIPGGAAGAPRAVVVWQDRTEERRLESSLMQAAKLAAIGQLAAGVAHEINNPLTAINANAQMLQMTTPGDHENYESVDLIARAGDRAAKVVRGLLDFARQAEYSFEPADVNESVAQALDLVSYQFTSVNVDVTIQLANDLPQINASWEHLQSVWLNLLINARDALLPVSRERKLMVSTRSDIGGDGIIVSVADTGRGMSQAELVHIFEPFYTTKAPGKGTGLGLATCQQIISQHGGEIEVHSQPGEGTTFIVHLPQNAEGDESG
ncbi:MAG: response regulator [Chloroflexota bacterium]|nr:MAG: response regulator [Chloroflexota bacterium]